MRRLIVPGPQTWRSALCLGLLVAPAARAEARPEPAPADAPAPVARTKRPELRYPHVFGALSLGRGMRFNNPYRLSTQLGESGESLSLTASYLDLALGATSARYGGFEHGGVVHVSIALSGISQEVVSLSYLVQRRFLPEFLLYARGGVPVIIEPDLNAGLELASGLTWLVRSGLGLNAELIGSLFYGAATIEKSVSTIPVLSLQIGIAVDYEVLP